MSPPNTPRMIATAIEWIEAMLNLGLLVTVCASVRSFGIAATAIHGFILPMHFLSTLFDILAGTNITRPTISGIDPEASPFRFKPRVLPHLVALLIPCFALSAAAEAPTMTTTIDPQKGELSESGKFQARIDPASAAPAPDPAARLAELGIKADQQTIRVGAVELDRKSMTVTIQATVNMLDGATEYFLVHRNGKIHESIFVTDARPQDIHVACLLAGWEPKEKPAEIEIEVVWETNGPPRRHRAEEFVAITKGHPQARDGRHIEQGPWHYTGSRSDAAGFAATREGSVIALITDPAALVTNPRPGRLDDTLHAPNRALLPAAGHPVLVILRKANHKEIVHPREDSPDR